MAQAGYTPIQLYYSSTTTNAPTAGNLASGELAINITDGKLFYKDNGGSVQVIAWKTTPTTAGGTGLTSWTAGDLPYYATGTTLSKLGIGTNGQILTSTGTAPQWSTLSGVAVTTFSAGTTGFTPSSATSGAVTLAGTLATTNGGTGLTSFTANGVVYASSSSALTTGSALQFSGTNLSLGAAVTSLTWGQFVGVQANYPGVVLSSTASGGKKWSIGADAAVLTFRNETDSTTAAVIDGSNNFGIGTSTPAYKLDVANGDAQIYGVRVGRGAGAVSTNTAVGASALAANTSGTNNAAFGTSALAANTSALYGTAIGAYALASNTTGNSNTGVGYGSLNVNTTGASNTALGFGSLQANTTASNNTAVGYQAGYSNTTGAANTVLGDRALYTNSTGSELTAVGGQALYLNTTGQQNSAFGRFALYSNTTGSYNTALGISALNSNTTASYNTAVGYQAGYSNTTGGENTYLGLWAGKLNTGGNYNIGIGSQALFNNTGSNNIAVGQQALTSNTTASNNTAVGYQAGYSNTGGTGIVAVGWKALYGNTTGTNLVAVGGNALASNTIGDRNVAVGYNALDANSSGGSNTTVGDESLGANTTGNYNTALGTFALTSNITASNNTALGYAALYSNTTASNNTAVGYQALQLNTTGTVNTAVGLQALQNNTTGADVTAVGGYALGANTTGSYNTAFGRQALASNTTASNNTAVGYQAGYNNQTGGSNVFIGTQAGYTSNISNNNGNTFVGNQAGYYATTGQLNAFFGNNSGVLMTTGSKNTIIGTYSGNQGGLDIRTSSNYIVLSDGDGNPRGVFDASGNLMVGTTSTANAHILQTATSGVYNTQFVSSTSSSPFGLNIQYTGAAPNGTGNEFLVCNDTGATRLTVRSNGGIANYQANDVNLSDRREKTNFAPAKSYLDTICAIPVQTFNYIDQPEDDPGLTLGVVAQDVQAVAPELVSESNWAKEGEDPKMRLSIYQTDLQYALMKCIQELKAELDSVKAELATLKGA